MANIEIIRKRIGEVVFERHGEADTAEAFCADKNGNVKKYEIEIYDRMLYVKTLAERTGYDDGIFETWQELAEKIEKICETSIAKPTASEAYYLLADDN